MQYQLVRMLQTHGFRVTVRPHHIQIEIAAISGVVSSQNFNTKSDVLLREFAIIDKAA